MRAGPALALVLLGLAGCSGETFSEAERREIAALSLASLTPLPPDPSNRVADMPAAAAFGATLFFDQRLSRDGTVACATCHVIDRQFQDDRPRGIGVGTTDRRTMPLEGAAWSPFLFWDGRRDSLWAQALVPMEDLREHAGTRAGYAYFVAGNYAERYARIFGALPSLDGVPDQAGPFGTAYQRAAWEALDAGRREDVDRVFSNLGKAIAAFERSLVPTATRFDRFAAALAAGTEPEADAALSAEEIAGLRLFVGKAQCSTCHTGPRFTDDAFHNTGVPAAPDGQGDTGRQAAVAEMLADPFNCRGAYSDAGPGQCRELDFIKADGPELLRAFKTPSLRGAATRPPYMHAGQIATIEAVVEHYAAAPPSVVGESEIHPLQLSERERAQLVAFLRTLAE